MFGCTQNIPNRWSIFSSHVFFFMGTVKEHINNQHPARPNQAETTSPSGICSSLCRSFRPLSALHRLNLSSADTRIYPDMFLIQMLNNISFDIYPEIYSHSPDISRYKFWLIACHQFQNPKLILTHINPSILTSIVAVTMTWSYFDMTANMLSGIAKKDEARHRICKLAIRGRRPV